MFQEFSNFWVHFYYYQYKWQIISGEYTGFILYVTKGHFFEDISVGYLWNF